MPRYIQPSFARGEFGPDLFGRVDVAAYAVGLRTAVNVIIHAYGGASNRPGMRFVGPCKSHSGTPPRLIEFKFNTQDTYVLEFGEQYMRVIRQDAHVLEPAMDITAVDLGATTEITVSSAHNYSNGDQVYIAGIEGTIELNGRFFSVTVVNSTMFSIQSQQTGAEIDSSSYGAYVSGGTSSRVYEIATPYAADDLMQVGVVQSANVMTLTHIDYPPQELSRTDHDAWELKEITFQPEQTFPNGISASTLGGAGTTFKYKVTAINEENEEESLAGLRGSTTGGGITNISQSNPAVVNTSVAHGVEAGDEVHLSGIAGMTELNDRRFTAIDIGSTNFSLRGEDSTTYNAYTSGGNVIIAHTTAASDETNPQIRVSWPATEGAYKYSVYRETNGIYGWLGDTELLSFDDKNIEPDVTISPPRYRNPFVGENNRPARVSYYEQRRVFGRTKAKPDTSFYTVTGSQSNLTQSSPRQADDAITATLNALEVNAIEAFVPLNDLIIMTSGQEWKVNSGDDVAFSAENLRQKPQSNWGSSYLAPIVVGDKVLFFTENRTYVRSLGYELTIDGYTGNDMTVFSPHIFDKYPAADWAFSRWPDPLILTVREDGWAPVLTFNPEQEVIAWSRWRTSGRFLRVAAILPEPGAIDPAGYYVVERTIQGEGAYYIERISSRRFADVRDCFFVDSGLSLDEPKAITEITETDPVVVTVPSHGFEDGEEVDLSDIIWNPVFTPTFSEAQPAQLNDRRHYVADKTDDTFALVEIEGRVDITGATSTNPVVITALDHPLEEGDVIGIFGVQGMVELNGRTFTIANVTTNTFELVGENGISHTTYVSGGVAYPATDGTAFESYRSGGFARKAVFNLRNLWHLEGREVVILADGNVISDKVVTNGEVVLDRKASRAHVGLRYVADIGTLNPEVSGGPGQTLQGRELRTPRVTLRVKESRGFLVGPSAELLEEVKQREFEAYGEPTNLLTGDKEVDVASDWDGGARVYVRQPYPLPLTVTAIIPAVEVGDEDEE